MIAFHKNHFLTGGLSSKLWSNSLQLKVSTVKEGVFKRECTIVFQIQGYGKLLSYYKPALKIFYEDSIPKSARLEWHGRIVEYLDRIITEDDSFSLDNALLKLHNYLVGQVGIEGLLHLEVDD
jgi:hypothetical protein